MDNLRFNIRRTGKSGRAIKVSLSLPESTLEELSTNEMQKIYNAIKHSEYMDANAQVGFDYTLDFPLEAGFGFPYILDFAMVDR